MCRIHSILPALLIAALSAPEANGGCVFLGPYCDFKGWIHVPIPPIVVYPVHTITQVGRPLGRCGISGDFNVADLHWVRPHIDVPVYVASYVKVKIKGDPEVEDPMTFIDVIAQDLDPGAPGLNLTGFNPTSPEIEPAGPGEFIGLSGTTYTATLQTCTLADLPFLLADFDVSAFIRGDPDSVVFIETADIPSADALAPEGTVPEPSTIIIWSVLGGLGIGVAWWRRRRNPLSDKGISP